MSNKLEKYKKSDWQKVKERFKLPWSLKTLCTHWNHLKKIKNMPRKVMEKKGK